MKNVPKRLKVFGIRTLEINGFEIHTCNIKINSNYDNLKTVRESGIGFKEVIVPSKKGISYNKSMLLMTYTTNDAAKFNNYTDILGKVLKKVAQTNLDQKYFWVD